MTIKRVLVIEDKNYNEVFQVSSSNGTFQHDLFDNIVIFDENEVAQKCIELVATYNSEDKICEIKKDELTKYIEDVIKVSSKKLTDEIIEVALDNVNDDEEIRWI